MSGGLNLSVDRSSEIPVGTQLAWKLRTLIGTGELEPGSRLPGIRELAEFAGVNVNTVRSVLARLEDQGLVVAEHGRGTFVADAARRPADLARTAAAVLSQAHAAGIDPRELAAALFIALPGDAEGQAGVAQKRHAQPAGNDERVARRRIRAEIERLELEVAELEPLAPLRERPSPPHARVLDETELQAVRDTLLQRLEQLRSERQEWQADANRRRAGRKDEPSDSPRWALGVWTGQPGAEVSWTTT
jgi:DNA-binding transcriptional regulator YhcF (GntR family)